MRFGVCLYGFEESRIKDDIQELGFNMIYLKEEKCVILDILSLSEDIWQVFGCEIQFEIEI